MTDVDVRLSELVSLLRTEWDHQQVVDAARDLTAAHRNPIGYAAGHADDAWVIEGAVDDVEYCQQRMLAWRLFDCLFDRLATSDHADGLVERLADVYPQFGEQMPTVLEKVYEEGSLEDAYHAVNEALGRQSSGVSALQLLEFDDGVSDSVNVLVVHRANVPGILALAADFGLPLRDTTG